MIEDKNNIDIYICVWREGTFPAYVKPTKVLDYE